MVTGGGSGIGRAVAQRLAARSRIVLVDNDPLRLSEAAGSIDMREPGGVITVYADVVDPDWLERAWEQSFDTPPSLTAFVACAGVACPGEIDDSSLLGWRRTMEVNGLGVMFSVREAVRLMRRHGGGTVVAIGSVAGRASYVGEPAYIASKHAVVGFCDSVRQELVGTGIRVSLVHPGFVRTPLTSDDPMMRERMGDLEPLLADDVARAVEFVIEQPPHANVTELVLRPSEQAL